METDKFFRLIADANNKQPGRHHLEPGLDDAEFLAWSWKHRDLTLPADLLTFMQKCNGLQLAVTKHEPRGFIEMFPLRETIFAPHRFYPGFKDYGDRWRESVVALAIDCDSDSGLALDLETGGYYDVDLIPGLEEDGLMGTHWGTALDWMCRRVCLIER